MGLLFSAHQGIGFDWGRLPVGADDHALERYTLSESPGQFDVSRDEQFLIPYAKAALTVKADLQFWAVPWTPPVWAKVEGTSEGDGFDKGLFDMSQADAYSDYLVSWVLAYQDRGIPIAFIMPQNDPGLVTSLPSCAFGVASDMTEFVDLYANEPVTLGPFVVESLVPALLAETPETQVWFGSLSNAVTFESYLESLTDASTVGGFGLEVEALSVADELWQQGLVTMQALHWPGNAPFRSETATSREDADRNSFLPSQAPNNHAYGEESWDLIKQWIDAGVSIYMAGNLVLDSRGFNLDVVRPWPQNALIAVDEEAGTYEVTPAYYVFRHVAQYVDIGANVVSIDGDALAFQNPDGSVVAVVYNQEETEVAHTIDIDGTLLDFVVPSRGWATLIH
jgi:glucosylceramidase